MTGRTPSMRFMCTVMAAWKGISRAQEARQSTMPMRICERSSSIIAATCAAVWPGEGGGKKPAMRKPTTNSRPMTGPHQMQALSTVLEIRGSDGGVWAVMIGDLVSVLMTAGHWEGVYEQREPEQLSWFEDTAETSLAWIDRTGIPVGAAILDAGGGASHLAAELVERGHTDVT